MENSPNGTFDSLICLVSLCSLLFEWTLWTQSSLWTQLRLWINKISLIFLSKEPEWVYRVSRTWRIRAVESTLSWLLWHHRHRSNSLGISKGNRADYLLCPWSSWGLVLRCLVGACRNAGRYRPKLWTLKDDRLSVDPWWRAGWPEMCSFIGTVCVELRLWDLCDLRLGLHSICSLL